MTQRDISTITAAGVLSTAAAFAVSGLGVAIPLWIPALVPILVAVVLFALRAYIAFVGADNTGVDESLATAQDLIDSARAALEKSGASRKP